MQQISLYCDNGRNFSFIGRSIAEASFFDEQTETLTRMRLFLAETKEYFYAINNTSDGVKENRVYKIDILDSFCKVSDGKHTLKMPIASLSSSVFALCNIPEHLSEDIKTSLEETSRLASA